MAPQITCECGECLKCKRRVYMRDYYRRNAERVRRLALESRNRRLDAVREYDRSRGKTKTRDPLKERARRVIRKMVENGYQRPPCEVCGTPQAEAHHEDYARPTDVRWLCRKHHMELHRDVAA